MPDVKRYSKPWHSFFKLYAKKINFNKYPKVRNAVDMLFGDISYMTEEEKSMNKLTDFLLCQKKI